jgi:mono/diheme cytochrome c family protein
MMKATPFAATLIALSCVANAAAADGTATPGQLEFKAKCASCHGADAKGHGPLAEYLKVPPADLTVLSRKNGGVFPYLHVTSMIDGRDIVKVHGARNMPVWGEAFEREASQVAGGRPVDTELHARQRIVALMAYLDQIQQK